MALRGRALIVGAGVSGFLHAIALRSAGLSIGAVFDPDRKRAELLASLVGGVALDAFDEITSFESEVAAVCSPPMFHVDQAEALARPRRLVFVEKPVALTPADLERLRAAPNIVPVLQWRAGRAARELRAALRAGAFGAQPDIRFDLRLWRDDAYFAEGRRGRNSWGCGAMLSIGIHAIDLLVWIVGRRVAVADGRERAGRAEVDVATRGEVTLLFEGGARAKLRLTLDAEGANDVRLSVCGPSASAELLAGEANPTASSLALRGVAKSAVAGAGGATGSPLLVPFIHEALAAYESRRPTVTVDDVAEAHTIAFRIRPAR